MNYIGDNNIPITSLDEKSINERIFEFNINKRDFFLAFRSNWDLIQSDAYEFSLGGESKFLVPAAHYVMIGDPMGAFDFLPVEELFTREFDIPVFDTDITRWNIEHPMLLQYVDNEKFVWPMTKYMIPIVSDNRVIMVSDKDHYHKLKDYELDMFVSTQNVL